MVHCEARPCSSLFPPHAESCVILRRVFPVARELTLSRDAVSAGSIPYGREDKILDYLMIPMTCGYLRLPTFVGICRWRLSFSWLSLPRFAVRWGVLRARPNSLVPDPTNEGASRVLKEDME